MVMAISPKVSILMTTYNHAAYIGQAVGSVMAQRAPFAFELVVGEDASTDATRAILLDWQARYPEQIQLRLRPHNWGRRRNFVDVLHACRGEYIAILEGDDYWIAPDKLQRQAALLDADPTCAICFTAAWKMDERRPDNLIWFGPGDRRPRYTLADLCQRNFMATCTVMFRNHLWPALPAWFATVPAGDWPLHVLNAQHGDIAYLDEVTGVHRIHAGGVWSARHVAARLEDKIEVARTLRDHLGVPYRAAWDNTLATFHWQLAWARWRKRPLAGLAYAVGLWVHRPVPWRALAAAAWQAWRGQAATV